MGGDILQNNYVEELKNGKQIRIKYNKLVHDWIEDDSGWMEELWCYDNKLDLFKCYSFRSILKTLSYDSVKELLV